MKINKKIKVATILAACATILAACGNNNSSSDSKKDEASFGLNTEVASMDTLKAQDSNSFDVQAAVFSGLYRLNSNDKVVPDIASGNPKLSNGNKTYTINLRHNAKWSNGTPVTAADFEYAWKRGANPKTKSNYGYILQTFLKNGQAIANGKISPDKLGVKAIGKYKLQVNLEAPTPYFKSLLTFNPYFPQNKKFVEKQGAKYATSPSTMIYNGPFKVSSYNQGASNISLTRNKDYVGPVKAHLQKINFNIIKNDTTGLNEYQAKKLDTTFISTSLVKSSKNMSGFKTVPNSMVTFLRFNQKNNSSTPFHNKALRTAIYNSLNTKQLADKVLQDGSSSLTGFIPPKFVTNPATGNDFRAEGGDLYKNNADTAKKAWATAKKQLRKDKINVQLLIDDEDWQKTTAEYIQSQLQKQLTGLTVSIRSIPQQQELANVAASKYQMVLGQWGPDYQDPNTYLATYISGNASGYNNKQFDKYIANANSKDVNDPAKRFEDFHQAEKLLVQDDNAIVPLNQQVYSILQRPNLKGITHHMVGAPFTYATAYWK